MNKIRVIKTLELFLRRHPSLYAFCKRRVVLLFKDDFFDFRGLVDNYATSPNVLYFRTYGALNKGIPIYYITFGVYNNEVCGFFGMFNTTLRYLLFADFYKLVPVINWGNCSYKEKQSINGTNNVWEYYF